MATPSHLKSGTQSGRIPYQGRLNVPEKFSMTSLSDQSGCSIGTKYQYRACAYAHALKVYQSCDLDAHMHCVIPVSQCCTYAIRMAVDESHEWSAQNATWSCQDLRSTGIKFCSMPW